MHLFSHEVYETVQDSTFVISIISLILTIVWGYKNKAKRLLIVLPIGYLLHLVLYYVWVFINREIGNPSIGTVWSSLIRLQVSISYLFFIIYFLFFCRRSQSAQK